MPMFRKKPVVEARQVTNGNIEQVADWCHSRHRVVRLSREEQWVVIPTLEGYMRASLGDYVIKGVQGEFYPCKPDIFDATYESVED